MLLQGILLAVLSSLATPLSASMFEADNQTCTDDPHYACPHATGWECQDGDVMIGILANMHRAGDSGQDACSQIQHHYVEEVAAAKWLLAILNEKNFIPGVKIGHRLLDCCERIDVAVEKAVRLQPGVTGEVCDTYNRPEIVAILNDLNSAQTVAVASNLRSIPLMTCEATAGSLSNKTLYPNVLRTISPDNYQAQVILDLVKQLQWYCIGIVHTEDPYGKEGAAELIRLAHQEGICLTGTISIPHTYSPNNIKRDLEKLMGWAVPAHGSSYIPVVYFGQKEGARRLIIEQARHVNAKSIIWIMSDDFGAADSVVGAHENLRDNVLAIEPATFDVDSLKSTWINYVTDSLHDVQNAQMQQYVEDVMRCKFYNNIDACERKTKRDVESVIQRLSPYITSILHGTYVIAQAMKDMHSAICVKNGVLSGMCNEMRREVKYNLLYYMQRVNYKYSLGAIDEFLGIQVSFDPSNGLLQTSGATPDYFIFSYECQGTCHFSKVGQYDGKSLELNTPLIKFDIGGNRQLSANSLSPLICQDRTCHDADFQFAYIPGDRLIVVILPIHKSKNYHECNNELEVTALETVAVHYALELYNGGKYEVFRRNGTRSKVGAIIFDGCRNEFVSFSLILRFHSGELVLRDPNGEVISPQRVIGYVAGWRSDTCLFTGQLLERLNIVHVGYGCTTVELTNKFSHFLRTIPSDAVLMDKVLEVVKKFNWTSFSLMYTDDAYGTHGYEYLAKKAAESNVCIAGIEQIPFDTSLQHYSQFISEALERLNDAYPRTRVLVLVMLNEHSRVVMQKAENKLYRFVFISTDAWYGDDTVLFEDPVRKEDPFKAAPGAITFEYSTPPTDFLNYIKEITPANTSVFENNPFLWQTFPKECKYSINSARCSPSMHIPNQNDYIYSYTSFLMKAVWAVAMGVEDFSTKTCTNYQELAKCLRSRKALAGIIKIMKEMKLPDGHGAVRKAFTADGDGAVTYRIVNIQLDAKGMPFYTVVPSVDEIKFYDNNGNIQNEVTSTCQYKCDICSPTSVTVAHDEHKAPDGSTIALATIVAVLLVALITSIIITWMMFTKYRSGRAETEDPYTPITPPPVPTTSRVRSSSTGSAFNDAPAVPMRRESSTLLLGKPSTSTTPVSQPDVLLPMNQLKSAISQRADVDEQVETGSQVSQSAGNQPDSHSEPSTPSIPEDAQLPDVASKSALSPDNATEATSLSPAKEGEQLHKKSSCTLNMDGEALSSVSSEVPTPEDDPHTGYDVPKCVKAINDYDILPLSPNENAAPSQHHPFDFANLAVNNPSDYDLTISSA